MSQDLRDAVRDVYAAAALDPDPTLCCVDGRAQELPVEDGEVEVVAQNCLFNVFAGEELERALAEAHRALKVGGRFSTSDPVAARPIPAALREDATLRARCVSGCRLYEECLAELHRAGFQQLVVRVRRPYRLLTSREFPALSEQAGGGGELLLESVEVLALKTPSRSGEPDVHTGRCAIYAGRGVFHLDDGFSFPSGTPVQVSDRVAERLARRPDFRVTPPTWHARGPGCC